MHQNLALKTSTCTSYYLFPVSSFITTNLKRGGGDEPTLVLSSVSRLLCTWYYLLRYAHAQLCTLTLHNATTPTIHFYIQTTAAAAIIPRVPSSSSTPSTPTRQHPGPFQLTAHNTIYKTRVILHSKGVLYMPPEAQVQASYKL